MRMIVAFLLTFALLLPACKPKQEESKPEAVLVGGEAKKDESKESKASSDSPLGGDLNDFQVTPSGSSASSGVTGK